MDEDPPARPKVSVEICWSTAAAGVTEGRLTWMVCEAKIPDECGKCGAPIEASEYSKNGKAIELTCGRGHKWRSVLQQLEERIEELGAERAARGEA